MLAMLDLQRDSKFLSRYFDHFSLIDRVFLFYIQPEALNVSAFAAW